MTIKRKIYQVTDQNGEVIARGTVAECAEQMAMSPAAFANLRGNCTAGRNTQYVIEIIGVEEIQDKPSTSWKYGENPCKCCVKGPKVWPKHMVSCACSEYCGHWVSWWKDYWRRLHEKYGRN